MQAIQHFPDLAKLSTDAEISTFFDLEKVVNWAIDGKFRCVAIQMADEVIPFSLNVISILRRLLPVVEFELLADSTLGNCCVDALSALHINADALVHFGHACLFPAYNGEGTTARQALCRNISVLLIFCRRSLDIAKLAGKYLTPLLTSEECSKSTCLLLYDVMYHHFITANREKLPDGVIISRPIVDEAIYKTSEHECQSNKECSHLHLCRRCFPGCTKEDNEFTVVYVGKRHSFELTEIMFTFLNSARRIVVFDPLANSDLDEIKVSAQLNRALGRRLYFVERVRDAESVGLVVSASSAAAVVTRTAVDYAKKLLKNVGKRVYVFCLGQLTPTKLAAYTEVDAFVFLGCPERALQIDSSEFYKPVVSFAEMEMACNVNRSMNCRFVPDLTDLLPGGSCFVLQSVTGDRDAEVSLVSNTVRSVARTDGGKDESFAGGRLSRRQWKGLDPSETDIDAVPKSIISGRKGIPIRYEDEVSEGYVMQYFYGNLTQDREHAVENPFGDTQPSRPSGGPPPFSRPYSGVGGAGAVPPIVLQLDRENRVIQMADAFLAHYENVRFLGLISANPDAFGHELLMPPVSTAQQATSWMRPPSPIVFAPSNRRTHLEGAENDLIVDSPNNEQGIPIRKQNSFPFFNISTPGDSDGNSSVISSSWRSDSNNKVFLSGQDSGVPSSSCDHVANAASEAGARFQYHLSQQMSAASWLVSERDVPQQLLPLPFSVPAIPPEWDPSNCAAANNSNGSSPFGTSPIRGSEEWAPPRFQIIWTLQPQKPVAQAAERQRYRCAGCGHLVDKRFLRSLRYCHYYGRYFCTQCHTGQKAILPSTVINNWDFTPYQVSEQAADLLQGIANEPYFFVAQINASLFKKHRCLREAQKYRLQLAYLATYVKQCREAVREQQMIGNVENCPPHLCDQANPSIYSISDLIGVRDKTSLNKWRDLVSSLRSHVVSCQTCLGRGYVCEGCWHREDIIFPFDVDSVVVCPVCRFCFHRRCHQHPDNPERCPRCIRLEQRRQQQEKKQQEERPTTPRTPEQHSSIGS